MSIKNREDFDSYILILALDCFREELRKSLKNNIAKKNPEIQKEWSEYHTKVEDYIEFLTS